MSVTLDTSQVVRSWLKAVAFRNIAYISVTPYTSQPLMSLLKAVALENIPLLFVMPETFQPRKSPLNASACTNMYSKSVTFDRSGTSEALHTKLAALEKALFIDVHWISPHCSIDKIFSISPPTATVPKLIRGKSPVI